MSKYKRESINVERFQHQWIGPERERKIIHVKMGPRLDKSIISAFLFWKSSTSCLSETNFMFEIVRANVVPSSGPGDGDWWKAQKVFTPPRTTAAKNQLRLCWASPSTSLDSTRQLKFCGIPKPQHGFDQCRLSFVYAAHLEPRKFCYCFA